MIDRCILLYLKGSLLVFVVQALKHAHMDYSTYIPQYAPPSKREVF